ncbi:MAG: hypothetical protein GC205_06270 [Bacteroidetes bacterium]|nr:hypothetical protein [Bacteroidota bacterium]
MAKTTINNPLFANVEKFFDQSKIRAFTGKGFQRVIESNRKAWGISKRYTVDNLLQHFINSNAITVNYFIQNSGDSIPIYSWKSNDDFTAMSGLKPNVYFSHYTSLYLHQLSLQLPKTIYLNYEHGKLSGADKRDVHLTQEAIDVAFKAGQRSSQQAFFFRDKKVVLLNGKYTNKLGVINISTAEKCYDYTDLERTLIDVCVRPVYAGGVFEVLEAFKQAKGKLNVAKLEDYLNALDFIYPYHQVVGFYLERAEYPEEEIERFRRESKFKFYLTYNMRNKEYSEKWCLYYPKGL